MPALIQILFTREELQLIQDCVEALHDNTTPDDWRRDAARDISHLVDQALEYSDNMDQDYDDGMDGDAESALASAGWGTDEDYGYQAED